jgi:P-type Ca2+ transporter type 2B
LEQWLWCIAFGVGSLLWAQVFNLLNINFIVFKVVTTIPTKGLPKSLSIGGGEVEPETANILAGDDDGESHEKRSGQILWIRGLTRLQTQVFDICLLSKKPNKRSKNLKSKRSGVTIK